MRVAVIITIYKSLAIRINTEPPTKDLYFLVPRFIQHAPFETLFLSHKTAKTTDPTIDNPTTNHPDLATHLLLNAFPKSHTRCLTPLNA